MDGEMAGDNDALPNAEDPCPDSFKHVYMLTRKRLYAVILSVVADPAEAEEALRETFVKVWHQGGRAQIADGDAMAWLVAIAQQTAADRLQRRQNQPAPTNPRWLQNSLSAMTATPVERAVNDGA